MAGVFDGVRVIDMGHFVAVPSAGAVLADWGAEVIKVEPLTGEPQRGVQSLILKMTGGTVNWRFEVHNRNKRSLAVDLGQESGRGILHRLIRTADVFLSNYEPRALNRLGADYATLSQISPGLVYASLTNYGKSGPDSDQRGFDMAAAWARTGMQHLLAEGGGPPPQSRGGVLDRTAGFHIVAGVSAALFRRERTGEGQELEFSLYHSGVWTLAADLQVTMGGLPVQIHDRTRAPNPLVNTYRAGDGRWLQLAMLQSDPSWRQFCLAVERPELEEDPRFAGMETRMENCEELVAILDAVFATRPADEWAARLRANDCIFGVVCTPEEVVADPQAHASGFFSDVQHPAVGEARMVTTPVKFSRNPASVRTTAPEVGQHTEEVLLELGYSWEDMAQLKESRVIL